MLLRAASLPVNQIWWRLPQKQRQDIRCSILAAGEDHDIAFCLYLRSSEA